MPGDSTRSIRSKAPSHKTALHTHTPTAHANRKTQIVPCASDLPATDWRFPCLPPRDQLISYSGSQNSVWVGLTHLWDAYQRQSGWSVMGLPVQVRWRRNTHSLLPSAPGTCRSGALHSPEASPQCSPDVGGQPREQPERDAGGQELGIQVRGYPEQCPTQLPL